MRAAKEVHMYYKTWKAQKVKKNEWKQQIVAGRVETIQWNFLQTVQGAPGCCLRELPPMLGWAFW